MSDRRKPGYPSGDRVLAPSNAPVGPAPGAQRLTPPVSPGISEERLAEIEKLAATMFYGDSVMVEVGVNLARASRELLAEVRRLRQQVERVEGYVVMEAADHTYDETRQCCSCGFAVWSAEHVAVMSVRRALGSSDG